ncbi:MAG TPA: hypothetical protein VNX21_02620, partial [Candidatus Thermoplasmatota archaeon]|nr:hypothetical protein [Candidatus Thermoplasmatota archaeon]
MHDQAGFDLRCEWGPEGLRRLAPASDAIVLVDVLSFCTAVDVCVARGVEVHPLPLGDARAAARAEALGARLAGPRGQGPSLSPPSLAGLPAGSRVGRRAGAGRVRGGRRVGRRTRCERGRA